ncbi:class IIb bacteriocin, lactobin A/cerein 7B family [Fructilactobacillus frigidiflavus]|uniref:class IIb bacteriocin, lactobin A/cerein 7B family n=1 Tax=Fructilactobacillus frigidiflavus TaxID=3242688 RepID=UPI00375752E9
MKNFAELNNNELSEIKGGFIPALIGAGAAVGALGLGIYNAGYAAGKDRALAGKRR